MKKRPALALIVRFFVQLSPERWRRRIQYLLAPNGKIALETEKYPTCDNAERLSAELSMLSKRQYEALQKASYSLMPRVEREAYDRRRVRIGELRELLTKFRPDISPDSSRSAMP